MRSAAVAAAIAATLASGAPASAELPAEPVSKASCAASFKARLADARKAKPSHAAYWAERSRIWPWYLEHCRQLSELEIAIRKLDDINAFVCDTQAGRPARLTYKRLEEFGYDYPVEHFQARAEESQACTAEDPVNLDMRAEPEPEGPAEAPVHELWQLRALVHDAALVCYGAKGATAAWCTKTQASNAAMIASITAEMKAREAVTP